MELDNLVSTGRETGNFLARAVAFLFSVAMTLSVLPSLRHTSVITWTVNHHEAKIHIIQIAWL